MKRNNVNDIGEMLVLFEWKAAVSTIAEKQAALISSRDRRRVEFLAIIQLVEQALSF